MRIWAQVLAAGVTGVLALAGSGCAMAPTTAAPRPTRTAATEVESRAGVEVDATLSGAEAAAVLRRFALVNAATHAEPWIRGVLLEAVWDDSRTWAEEAAVLELLEPFLRAQPSGELRSATERLRAEMARASLVRGDAARARLLLASLDPTTGVEARVELTFALEGRAAAERVVQAADGYLDEDEVGAVFALAEARWGDGARAAQQVDALDPLLRCEPAVELAQRHFREGQAGAGRWLDVAAASLVAQAEARGFMGDCAVGLIRTAQRLGDVARLRSFAATAPTWMSEDLCNVVRSTFDVVDPTLLDVPLATAVASEAESGVEPWDRCSDVIAELAARRGDRRAALRFLVRDHAEGGAEDSEVERARYGWSARVRLGRADPLAPYELGGRTLDALLLAHLFEERPDTSIDRARFASALEVDPDGEDPSDGDAEEPDADDGSDPE